MSRQDSAAALGLQREKNSMQDPHMGGWLSSPGPDLDPLTQFNAGGMDAIPDVQPQSLDEMISQMPPGDLDGLFMFDLSPEQVTDNEPAPGSPGAQIWHNARETFEEQSLDSHHRRPYLGPNRSGTSFQTLTGTFDAQPRNFVPPAPHGTNTSPTQNTMDGNGPSEFLRPSSRNTMGNDRREKLAGRPRIAKKSSKPVLRSRRSKIGLDEEMPSPVVPEGSRLSARPSQQSLRQAATASRPTTTVPQKRLAKAQSTADFMQQPLISPAKSMQKRVASEGWHAPGQASTNQGYVTPARKASISMANKHLPPPNMAPAAAAAALTTAASATPVKTEPQSSPSTILARSNTIKADKRAQAQFMQPSPTPANRLKSSTKLVCVASDSSPAKGMFSQKKAKKEPRKRSSHYIPEMSSAMSQFQVQLNTSNPSVASAQAALNSNQGSQAATSIRSMAVPAAQAAQASRTPKPRQPMANSVMQGGPTPGHGQHMDYMQGPAAGFGQAHSQSSSQSSSHYYGDMNGAQVRNMPKHVHPKMAHLPGESWGSVMNLDATGGSRVPPNAPGIANSSTPGGQRQYQPYPHNQYMDAKARQFPYHQTASPIGLGDPARLGLPGSMGSPVSASLGDSVGGSLGSSFAGSFGSSRGAPPVRGPGFSLDGVARDLRIHTPPSLMSQDNTNSPLFSPPPVPLSTSTNVSPVPSRSESLQSSHSYHSSEPEQPLWMIVGSDHFDQQVKTRSRKRAPSPLRHEASATGAGKPLAPLPGGMLEDAFGIDWSDGGLDLGEQWDFMGFPTPGRA